MVGVICVRYLRDGSFWLDEASLALNFQLLGLVEFFSEPLKYQQQFPRWYYLLVKGLQESFGYHTSVLRFLPFLCSVIATFLWLRLLRVRFERKPLLLALALVLMLIPTVWFAFSAMLKQYSFDMLIALIPFCLRDDFYERALGKGEGRWKLLPLCALTALSYSAVIAVLGRVAGWYVAGIVRGRLRYDLRAMALFAGGILVFLGLLWFTDLRHTVGEQYLYAFHERCVIGSDWSRTHQVLDRMAVGWYAGGPEFYRERGLPPSLMTILRIFFLVGVAGIALSALRGIADGDDRARRWGSRSLGCLVAVAGLVLASIAMRYPACAGRLTLFAFFPLQIVLLEGIDVIHSAIARRESRLPIAGLPLANLALGLLLAAMLPAVQRNLSHMALRDVPANMKPLLAHIRERPELPVLVTPCSRRQVEAHPGGLGAARIVYLPFDLDMERDLPLGEEVWILNAHQKFTCRQYMRTVAGIALEQRKFYVPRENTAELMLLRLPEKLPASSE
jgi:hypothetical protein